MPGTVRPNAFDLQLLPQEKVQELTIQLSQLANQGDLIKPFSALKPMNRNQIPDDSQVTIHGASISVDPFVRAFQHRERKRDLPVDSATLKTNRPAKVLACYRNRPPCETLIRQLLRTKLYNSSNACYINAALLGQFWATLAYEGFDPELTSRMQQNFWVGFEDNTSIAMFRDRSPMAGKYAWPTPPWEALERKIQSSKALDGGDLLWFAWLSQNP